MGGDPEVAGSYSHSGGGRTHMGGDPEVAGSYSHSGGWPYSHACDAPLCRGVLGGLCHDRQPDQTDGGGDGQGPDVPEEEAEHAAKTDRHLEQSRGEDPSLHLLMRTVRLLYTSIPGTSSATTHVDLLLLLARLSRHQHYLCY